MPPKASATISTIHRLRAPRQRLSPMQRLPVGIRYGLRLTSAEPLTKRSLDYPGLRFGRKLDER
jgi:hypothetical protein